MRPRPGRPHRARPSGSRSDAVPQPLHVVVSPARIAQARARRLHAVRIEQQLAPRGVECKVDHAAGKVVHGIAQSAVLPVDEQQTPVVARGCSEHARRCDRAPALPAPPRAARTRRLPASRTPRRVASHRAVIRGCGPVSRSRVSRIPGDGARWWTSRSKRPIAATRAGSAPRPWSGCDPARTRSRADPAAGTVSTGAGARPARLAMASSAASLSQSAPRRRASPRASRTKPGLSPCPHASSG